LPLLIVIDPDNFNRFRVFEGNFVTDFEADAVRRGDFKLMCAKLHEI